MTERHLGVTRTARYVTLGADPREGGRPSEIWFVLHGYGQLAHRFLRRFRELADGRRFVIAPEALNRFYVGEEEGRHGTDSLVGGTWMTRHDREREIGDYVGYLDRLAEHVFSAIERRSVRFTLLGFSQGLQTASRWVALGSWPPDALILWGDYIPPDLDMVRFGRAMEGRRVTVVAGDTDPSRRPELEADQRARLEAAGVDVDFRTHPGGHEIDRRLLTDLATRA